MSISVIGLDESVASMLVGKAIRSCIITQYCYIFPGIFDQAEDIARAVQCPCLQNVKL